MYAGAYLRCCVVCFSLFHGAKLGTNSRIASFSSLKNFMYIINFRYNSIAIRDSEGKRG
jgi:hypothetical protein